MITDFLKTDKPKHELAIALEIIRDYKKCENLEAHIGIPFVAWAKLEQLQEFLEHLVEGHPLQPDTIQYIKEHNT